MTREEQINKEAYRQEKLVDMDVESFIAGAKWADANPKSPWINVDEDLPYNHEELINTHTNLDYEKETVLVFTVTSEGIIDTDYMVYDNYDGWFWRYGLPKYWIPMPKLPKE